MSQLMWNNARNSSLIAYLIPSRVEEQIGFSVSYQTPIFHSLNKIKVKKNFYIVQLI